MGSGFDIFFSMSTLLILQYQYKLGFLLVFLCSINWSNLQWFYLLMPPKMADRVESLEVRVTALEDSIQISMVEFGG